MPTWTIVSPGNPVFKLWDQIFYGHPMRVNIYRVMKVVYYMLDPSNEPSSTVDEVKPSNTRSHKKIQVLLTYQASS
jgi:hypothetical protein